MNWAEGYVKNMDTSIMDKVQSIKETVDDIEPIQFYNKITKRNDYGIKMEDLEMLHPDLLQSFNDKKGVAMCSLIPILLNEIKLLKVQCNTLHETLEKIKDSPNLQPVTKVPSIETFIPILKKSTRK